MEREREQEKRGPWGGGWAGAWCGPGGKRESSWAGPMFGGSPWAGMWGGPPPWGRRPKAKRGDVRAAILALLAEGPRNGYQIITDIEERTEGTWRPSPGAVYPALQQLSDEGLIVAEEGEGRRTYGLTEAGHAYVEAHPTEVRTPWDDIPPDAHAGLGDLFKLAAQTGAAVVQVAQAGTEEHVAEARNILSETKRKLYNLLAEDE
jgi:DNA-binding PadR family transcriptional regulator